MNKGITAQKYSKDMPERYYRAYPCPNGHRPLKHRVEVSGYEQDLGDRLCRQEDDLKLDEKARGRMQKTLLAQVFSIKTRK